MQRAQIDENLVAPHRRAMTDKTARFHQLHESGCFVIPNPWDAGSARLLAQMGFPALATTSSGFAWTLGRADNRISLDDALAHLRAVSAAVDVPVSADFENGFATEPEQVAANVTAATATGIAGLSIEDSTGDATKPLFDFDLAVARVRAAREAIDAGGSGALLTARCEAYLFADPSFDDMLRRLRAYSDAGADCLYAPGMRDVDEIRRLVEAVAPKPINVLVSSGFTTVEQLRAIGVRRISVGGALARAAWSGFFEAAREIAEEGTFTALGRAVGSSRLNGAFAE